MSKKLVVFVVLLTALLVVGYTYISNPFEINKPQIEFVGMPVNQKVVTEPALDTGFETLFINSGTTALELLQKDHSVVLEGEGESAFITSIDGRKTNRLIREFWAFYVNGKQSEVGAGSYKLQPNDKIEWKIETY